MGTTLNGANPRRQPTRVGAPVVVDADELGELREYLARHCLPHMNALRERAPIPDGNHRTVADLLSRLAPIFSRGRPEDLAQALRNLTNNRRLTARSLPYRRLIQFCRAGILVRTNRGVYAITPEYRLAFQALRCGEMFFRRVSTRSASSSAEIHGSNRREAAE